MAAILSFSACSEDDLSSESIFSTTAQAPQNEFDAWLQKNYVEPYNIEFKYRFEYNESDTKYNLAPADYNKSIALAKLTKYLWIESYEELMGRDFIRIYAPKILNLIGSVAYDSGGGVVLGTAEGGMKIVLYNVNNLNYEKIDMAFLNEWYFVTMHHEFAHILHQTKNYPTSFNEISKSDYQSSSWVNLEDQEALEMGFVNNYASSEAREDFVQTIAFYITYTDEMWEKLLEKAVVPVKDENGDVIYELDSNGNPVLEKDAEGNPIPETDSEGNVVYQRDLKGNILYTYDREAGTISPVPEYKKVVMYPRRNDPGHSHRRLRPRRGPDHGGRDGRALYQRHQGRLRQRKPRRSADTLGGCRQRLFQRPLRPLPELHPGLLHLHGRGPWPDDLDPAGIQHGDR